MEISEQLPPTAATDWRVYRTIPSIYPPVSIFDRVAEPHMIEALALLESRTNSRVREEMGKISLVPVKDRVSGPGTTPVMAAFTHIKQKGDRFSDGTYGVYYASPELETSIAESKHHRENFLRDTKQGPIDVDMRVYLATAQGQFHDLRHGQPAEIFDPDDYSASQKVGKSLRDAGSDGLIYNSVRREGGLCLAAFRPRLITKCLQERHLTYRWNGDRITDVYEKKAFNP